MFPDSGHSFEGLPYRQQFLKFPLFRRLAHQFDLEQPSGIQHVKQVVV